MSSYLADARCKSVGVSLAAVRAAGAGAPSRAPAAGEAAASLTGADRGSLNGGGLTWLLVHGPDQEEDRTASDLSLEKGPAKQ